MSCKRQTQSHPKSRACEYHSTGNFRRGKILSKDQIKAIIESLRTFIPGFISIEGEKIGIQGTPDKILSVVSSQISNNVPSELQEMYLQAFTSTE